MACKTITIFSNKGGVGKTFIGVNLATAMAQRGKKVLLLDMDFQAGQDLARMLNVAPRHSLVDIMQGSPDMETMDVREQTVTHSSGLDYLPAVKQIKQIGHISPDIIKPFLKRASAQYDFIIVDGGKTFSEPLIAVLDHSNLIFLVATPDILAVYQVKWTLDVLQSLHYPSKMIKLILNRSESRGGVAWQDVNEALTCEIFARIPSDGKVVGMALNRGVPCVIDSPRAKVSDAFIKMASDLERDDIFASAMDAARKREDSAGDATENFWEKFGINPNAGQSQVFDVKKEEDQVIKLKKEVHEQLVSRMNLERITPEALSDPKQAQNIRRTASQIVADLIAEVSGGTIQSHEERAKIVKEIVNEALGLGPLEDFLADPDVTDIMVNNKEEIYVEKKGKIILTNKRFVSDGQVRSIIDRIIAPLGRRIDESVPMVDARLPDGSRINAIIPPLSLNGPMITIRKFSQERYTADDLIEKFGSLNLPMAQFLQACVVGRKNMIVSGGTGAGKTTLLNIVSHYIPDDERIITIEDAAELKLNKSHWARLESRPSNVEGKGQITIRDLFTNSLRMRPDRIVIGECRGSEVLDMLQAMNTGHDGSLTTLHANSTRDVMARMSSMILLSAIELPLRAIYEMVASAIDIVVHVARFSDGTRKITGISEVTGKIVDGLPELKDVFIFDHQGLSNEGKVLGDFKATGYVPQCYEEFVTRGMKIDQSIFS